MRKLRTAVLVAVIAATGCVLIATGASPATTPAAKAATPLPAATTGTGTTLSPSSESVTGFVNPNGQSTNYYFEYGPSTSYGARTATLNAGNGAANVPVTATLTGLVSGGVYHFRLVAVNNGGTTDGADGTFTAAATASTVRVLGREGFVSPGRVIGVQVGCFDGQTICAGHMTMTHDGILVGERDFSLLPSSGGFQNMKLTDRGEELVRHNSVFNLVGVNVTVHDATNGQTLTFVIHLARWVWH